MPQAIFWRPGVRVPQSRGVMLAQGREPETPWRRCWQRIPSSRQRRPIIRWWEFVPTMTSAKAACLEGGVIQPDDGIEQTALHRVLFVLSSNGTREFRTAASSSHPRRVAGSRGLHPAAAGGMGLVQQAGRNLQNSLILAGNPADPVVGRSGADDTLAGVLDHGDLLGPVGRLCAPADSSRHKAAQPRASARL